MADSEKQFLVIDENGKGHLPVRESADGALDHGMMGAAHAALHGGFRGNKYEGPDKEAAIAKLKKMYEEEKIPWPEERASEVSFDRIREMVQAAVWKKWPPPKNGPWTTYIREVFAGYSILELSGKLVKVPYTINEGVAELGEPETVEPAYVAASEPVRGRSVLLDAMPAAGADGLIEIPIAVTGSWKRGTSEFSITKQDLAAMVANFAKRKNGEINVDYDHASEMPEVARGGPVPSAGRILKMRSNGALYAGIKFTKRALELIKAEEYRFVSPAIGYGVTDKSTGEDQGTTLTSLALTNRPFLEELPPIKLSEIQESGVRSQEPGNPPGPAPQTPGTRLQGGTMSEPITIKTAEGGKLEVFRGSESLGTAEVPASAFEMMVEQEQGKARAQLLAQVGMSGKEVKDVRERLATADRLEKEWTAKESHTLLMSEAVGEDGLVNRKKEIELVELGRINHGTAMRFDDVVKKVDEAQKTGKITPANRRFFLGAALSNPEGFDNFVASTPPVVPMHGIGFAGGGEATPAKRFLALVKEREKDGKVSYAQALSDIGREYPELYADYSKAVQTK